MEEVPRLSADSAMALLVEGNAAYVRSEHNIGDISAARRLDTADNGQHPYAVVVSCSDSRVIPEAIFSTGIGDLFVIRTAGNTIDKCTLGSIEYAVSHLGCRLVVILGHTGCGAVTAALHSEHIGHVGSILRKIKRAVGHETDMYVACGKNVQFSLEVLRKMYPEEEGARYVGGMYDIRTGEVRFLD